MEDLNAALPELEGRLMMPAAERTLCMRRWK